MNSVASERNYQVLDLFIELKRVFNLEKLELTMSFSIDLHHLGKNVQIYDIAEYFDSVHFMPTPMEFSEIEFKRNDIHYIIFELQLSTIQQKVVKLLEAGLPKSKLILGINFRGN